MGTSPPRRQQKSTETEWPRTVPQFLTINSSPRFSRYTSASQYQQRMLWWWSFSSRSFERSKAALTHLTGIT